MPTQSPHPPPHSPQGWALWLIAICLSSSLSGRARAADGDSAGRSDDVTLAEQKAAKAFEAFQEKRYPEAVALYLDAYGAAPNADMLYNIARIYDTKLSDRQLAISFYRRYVAEPGAIADRIQIANERLVALREAEFAASEPVDPTARESPKKSNAGAASSPRAREPGWSAAEVAGAILGSAGIVGVGVGTGFGIAAVNETHQARDLCDENVCREQRGIDAAESATDHALVSTIGFASGGALLALGAVFYFWSGDETRETEMQASERGVELIGARFSQGHGAWALEVGGSW